MDQPMTSPPPRPPERFRWTWIMLFVLLAVLAARQWLIEPRPLLNSEAAPRVVTARGDLAQEERATIELFEHASRSVVFVTTQSLRRNALTMNVTEIPRGAGSGFVWDAEGSIVTNFHVIENADRAKVTLADHSSWDARLVGASPENDLVVLRIDAPQDRLVPLPVGQSQDIQVGQKTFAIGNPFGLDQTLTTGVVSGLDREIKSVTGRPIRGVIQTDAAINPGNSGGPLLDSSGRLIGVNTAIVSPSGAYAGIGFAVPVDTVNRIVPELIRHGKVVQPGFGISIVRDQIARQNGLVGVLVADVLPDGAAAQAGMRPLRRDENGNLLLGDLIIAIDGEAIRDSNDLYAVLEKHTVGDVVTVTVRRDEANVDLSVTLQAVN